MSDIIKAYHVVNTREDELHLRRFLHRASPAEPWRICAYTCATFGDGPTGLMLYVLKRRVADLGEEINEETARKISEHSSRCYSTA